MTSYTDTVVGRPTLAATLVRETLGQQPVIAVPAPFIQMLGDCPAAAFLSQCCYFSEHRADPEGWFEHSHDAWRTLLNLSPDQIRRCLRVCTGLVEVKRRGIPARNFYRVNPETIRERLLALHPLPVAEERTVCAEGQVQTSAAPAPVSRPLPISSDRETPPQVVRQTPLPSSIEKFEEKTTSKRDDVSRVTLATTEALTQLLDIWNEHWGTLPKASGLSTGRRRALSSLLSDCGMISALHCRLLGLVVAHPTPDAVTGVTVKSAASEWSSLLLGLPWAAAGGPVLGRREGGEIRMTHLIAGGSPWEVRGPLEMSAPYVLGALDALNQGGGVDWVGYWVWSGRTHTPTSEEAWLRAAYDRGLIDEMRPLLLLSRTRDQAIFRALSGGEEGEELPCHVL